jgi:hypothetical protein
MGTCSIARACTVIGSGSASTGRNAVAGPGEDGGTDRRADGQPRRGGGRRRTVVAAAGALRTQLRLRRGRRRGVVSAPACAEAASGSAPAPHDGIERGTRARNAREREQQQRQRGRVQPRCARSARRCHERCSDPPGAIGDTKSSGLSASSETSSRASSRSAVLPTSSPATPVRERVPSTTRSASKCRQLASTSWLGEESSTCTARAVGGLAGGELAREDFAGPGGFALHEGASILVAAELRLHRELEAVDHVERGARLAGHLGREGEHPFTEGREIRSGHHAAGRRHALRLHHPHRTGALAQQLHRHAAEERTLQEARRALAHHHQVALPGERVMEDGQPRLLRALHQLRLDASALQTLQRLAQRRVRLLRRMRAVSKRSASGSQCSSVAVEWTNVIREPPRSASQRACSSASRLPFVSSPTPVSGRAPPRSPGSPCRRLSTLAGPRSGCRARPPASDASNSIAAGRQASAPLLTVTARRGGRPSNTHSLRHRHEMPVPRRAGFARPQACR